MDGIPELTERLAELDADDEFAADDVERFVSVMQFVTSTGTPPDVGELPAVYAADADALTARCQLLARLRERAPSLVDGPLAPDAQRWIATGKPEHVPAMTPQPSAERFVAAEAALIEPSAKPFDVGMYTCTAVGGGQGMWRAYLDLNRDSTLFPPPWRVWALRAAPDVRVREITSATAWAAFVCHYPRRGGSLLYPDWASAARDLDAVHMTLPAIVATQGLCLTIATGLIAAPYWDVESTLWLRWKFTDATLIETVG